MAEEKHVAMFGVRLRPVVEVGHLLQAAVMLLAASAFILGLEARLSSQEKALIRLEQMQEKETVNNRDMMREFRKELAAQVGRLQQALDRLGDRLDRRMDDR